MRTVSVEIILVIMVILLRRKNLGNSPWLCQMLSLFAIETKESQISLPS
jgi:hypothetical protein